MDNAGIRLSDLVMPNLMTTITTFDDNHNH